MEIASPNVSLSAPYRCVTSQSNNPCREEFGPTIRAFQRTQTGQGPCTRFWPFVYRELPGQVIIVIVTVKFVSCCLEMANRGAP